MPVRIKVRGKNISTSALAAGSILLYASEGVERCGCFARTKSGSEPFRHRLLNLLLRLHADGQAHEAVRDALAFLFRGAGVAVRGGRGMAQRCRGMAERGA